MKPSTILFLIILGILVLFSMVLAVGAYQYKQRKAEEVVEVEKSIPVHVVTVSRGKVEDIVYVTGFVEPAERVDVYAKIPMPGKLIAARVQKGDFVKKDRVLATVDRDEVGAIYRKYEVEAPISGIVAAIMDSPGMMVAAQVPVAVIVKIDKVKVKTSIIEADLGRVKEGIPARIRVDAYPDRVFEGKLGRIEPVFDSFSHTAPVEINIDNADHALLPGMFARIELVGDVHENVSVVPKGVIFKREGKDLAYVIKSESGDAGKTRLRIDLTEISLGYYDLERFEIMEGAEVGDLLVDRDQVVLKDRTRVTVMNPPEGWAPPGPDGGISGAKDKPDQEAAAVPSQ